MIVNKADVVANKMTGQNPRALFVSAKTGQGIPELLERLAHEIDIRFADTGAPPLTRARHRQALEECRGHLERALKGILPPNYAPKTYALPCARWGALPAVSMLRIYSM